MRFSKIGSFVLILLVAFATAETVEKAKDVSVETSESNTEIPGVTENVVQESSNATQEDLAEIIALGGAEVDKDNGENVKLEREALLEKRSIGNIARLLLGGNVPPNHPLVKNPEAKTFNLASNIVASVPGREFGSSGWNSGGGWNSNTLSQISQLLSTKQKLIPHISQLTNGVTGIAGIKGDLFRQIQTISTAAIAQAAAEAAAKAVAASAAAQAVTNTIQHNNAIEDAKHNPNSLLQGWYSNNQNTYATLPTPVQSAANSILTPYTQSSQVNNQFSQRPTQPGNYHSSYTQYQQQQQQQLLQQQQQQMNNLFTQQQQQNNNNNNYNPVSNNYNSANNYNSPSNSYNPAAAPNFASAPLVAAPSNLNQAQGSSVGSRNVPPSNNYNSQASPAAFNSPGNSFGAAAHTNNAPQYSPAPTGNSFNNQQLPAAQNYGGYNNNGGSSFNRGPNNNFNNNYNRNAPVGGSGPGSGYVSGQYSQPAGSHVYPPNGQGGYSGPPPGNSNSASGVSGGYPNAQYHPSASSPGNQYSNNGPQNFQHPGPPYNSPSSDAYAGPPPPSFNSPQGSYSNSNPNFGPQQQQGAYGFSGNGNSNINRHNNLDSAAPNNFNNYNNNYNRQNDNQFNGNQNRPSLYDNNNNNNYNRNPYDDNLNRNKNPNNFQGHSRFENSPIGTNAFHKGTRKGGGYYNNRNDEADNIEDSLEKREWSSPHKKVVVGGEKTTTYHTLTIREDDKNPVKAVYKELYNPHKHRWTEYPPRRGQIDDRPNFSAHPKSKFGPSRRAHHGHRGRPRHREPEQPREIYTTLPEYVFRNDRPNRSTNTSALLIPVDADYISTEDSVVNVSPLVEHVTDSSNLLVPSSVSDGVVVGSLPSTLTISLPSAEESSKIVPAITVFETSYVS